MPKAITTPNKLTASNPDAVVAFRLVKAPNLVDRLSNTPESENRQLEGRGPTDLYRQDR
jgi:hypothetical protein